MKKRLFCMFLALVMSFSLGTMAFASDGQMDAENEQIMTMEQIEAEVQILVEERMAVVEEQLEGYPEVYELAYRWYLQDSYTQMLLYENGNPYPGTVEYRFDEGGIIYYETSEELEEFGVDMAFAVTLLTPEDVENGLPDSGTLLLYELVAGLLDYSLIEQFPAMTVLMNILISMSATGWDDVEEADGYAEIICMYGIEGSVYPDGVAAVSVWHEHPFKYISEGAQNVHCYPFSHL